MSANSNELNIRLNENSKMKKFFILLVMVLLLLIPIGFWFGIIKDREAYKNEAMRDIASAWGDAQVFSSPVMYFEQKKDKTTENVYLTLNDYNVDAKITTEIRKKGIFKVPVYTAEVTLKGDFTHNNINITGKDITTSFQVTDSIGFTEEPKFKINNAPEVIAQDTKYTTKLKNPGDKIPFEISYKIRGLNELFVNLGGQINNVNISGNWADPSFTGNFLPSEREVTNEGFSAKWRVPKVATTNVAPVNPDTVTKYTYNDAAGNVAKAGVTLLMPVDSYRMTERALKYAFLFITLTFLTYFIFELTDKSKKKIHPLQYLLLGGAMLIFYLLLVSISEFAPFAAAYIISSLMTIGLISTYTHCVITKRQNARFSATVTALLVLLYTFLYILLQLQDLALLLGSLALFLIIALIMYATRNVDWYNEN